MSNIYKAIEKFDGKAKIVSLVYQSVPDMVKGGRKNDKGEYPNRFIANDGTPRIHKISLMNGIIGTDYQRVVQNRTDDSTFSSKQLWNGKGEHINKYLVKHSLNHRVYLAFLLNGTSQTKYVWNSGKELTSQEIDEMMLWGGSKNKPSVEDKSVDWRVLPLDNILELRMDKKVYSK